MGLATLQLNILAHKVVAERFSDLSVAQSAKRSVRILKMAKQLDKSILKGFHYSNKDDVLKKLDRIFGDGKANLHLVLDFDRTLTTRKNKFGEDVTTWEILKQHLSDAGQKEYQKFFETYRPKEARGEMTQDDATVWWESIIRLYQSEGLNLSMIEKDVNKRMPIRRHAKTLLELCEKEKIPTIIVSAGLKDVIELWCSKFKLNPTVILSTKLIFSKDGVIKGWYKKSLIHVLNKKEKGHKEITKIRTARPNTILIGDSMDDAGIVEGEENVLRILIYAPRRDDDVSKFNKAFKKFDLIIKSRSFLPVVQLVTHLV